MNAVHTVTVQIWSRKKNRGHSNYIRPQELILHLNLHFKAIFVVNLQAKDVRSQKHIVFHSVLFRKYGCTESIA